MGALATMEVGSGPPVLLVHGLNGFKEGWGPLPEALAAAGLRAVAVDLPGFGASPRVVGAPTSPRSFAAALAPLVARLAPVAVVGHSLGTQVAMIIATGGADRVPRAVLISPWILARPPRFPPKSVSDLVQYPVLGPLLARVAISRIRRDPERRRAAYTTAIADPRRMADDPALRGLLQEASDRLERADLRAMAAWASTALRLDAMPLAGGIDVPTLVVQGALDRVTKPPGARRLADALPDGTLYEAGGVGHFPHLERPDLVVPAILAHLG